MQTELKIHKAFSVFTFLTIVFLGFNAFTPKTAPTEQFSTIDVERINIVEPDGTVKLIITNIDQFPTGEGTKVNGYQINAKRKKRAGMLFFNEDGIECGGFIYDGQKTENGHSSGLSLTYDQYDSDQVMQLLNIDSKGKSGKRKVRSMLMFNDYPLDDSKTNNKMGRGTPRIMLGKTGSENNGLVLFDDKGKPKAMFYIGTDNKPRLETFNDKMEVVHSWPE